MRKSTLNLHILNRTHNDIIEHLNMSGSNVKWEKVFTNAYFDIELLYFKTFNI